MKKNLPQKYSYIKNIMDFKKVIISKTSEGSLNYISCPITGLQYNGFNKFVCLWTCGHILSKKAFKQMKTNDRICVVCDAPYQDKDVINMNLKPLQLEPLRKFLIQKKNKSNKQTKNTKKEKQEEGEPQKKVKLDVHLSPIQKLGDDFRDVIRRRENFKEIFHKTYEAQWKTNTFTAKIEKN